MLIPNHLVYKPIVGPARLGSVWLDVPAVPASDAPVVLERVDAGEDDRRYRSYGGRLWEVQYTIHGNRKPPEEMKVRIHPGLEACKQLPQAEVIGYKEQLKGWSARDNADGTRDLLSSREYRRLAAAVEDRLIIDDVLHRATPGPLVRWIYDDEWAVQGLVWGDERTPARLMSVVHQGEQHRGRRVGRLVEHGPLPPKPDLLPMNIEAACWYAVMRTSRMRLTGLPKDIAVALIDIRRILEARRPDAPHDYTRSVDHNLPIDGESRTWAPIDDALAPLHLVLQAGLLEKHPTRTIEGILERAQQSPRPADDLSHFSLGI